MQQEEQHRAAERAYWRRELSILWWLNFITVIAVVGGIASLIYLKQTLDATWLAAETAMRQLELSERPWVTAEVALTRSFSTSGKVDIEVSVKNVGRSVAIDVAARAEIVFDPILSAIENGTITFPLPDPSEIDFRREMLCRERFRQTERRIEYTQNRPVLFPEQSGTIQAMSEVEFSEEVKEKAFRWRLEDETVQESFEEPLAVDMFVSPVLIGCVTYWRASKGRGGKCYS